MMNDQQVLSGAVRVRQIVVAVFRHARARRIRTLHFPRFDCRLQMRLEHRHLGVERGFDLGELDLPLRLDLEVDRVGLRPIVVLIGLGEERRPNRAGLNLDDK
jgi:hypothetical protein